MERKPSAPPPGFPEVILCLGLFFIPSCYNSYLTSPSNCSPLLLITLFVASVMDSLRGQFCLYFNHFLVPMCMYLNLPKFSKKITQCTQPVPSPPTPVSDPGVLSLHCYQVSFLGHKHWLNCFVWGEAGVHHMVYVEGRGQLPPALLSSALWSTGSHSRVRRLVFHHWVISLGLETALWETGKGVLPEALAGFMTDS